MKIIVTGADGFIGRVLMKRLRAGGHEPVAVDRAGAVEVTGDIADRDTLDRAFAGGCDAVIHLATVPGGAAEQDPAAAKRINVEASMLLAEAAAAAGQCPRFIFASSIALFGDPLPTRVDDETPPAPCLLYGAHKAMIETWLTTLSRRGAVDALSLRLPGIVARPAGISGMKSAFMSDIFHALKAGRPFVSPVSQGATLWLMSVDRVVTNIVHSLDHRTGQGALTLPAQRIRMADLVFEIAGQTGCDPALVHYEPDALLEAGFGRMPPLSTPAADRLGFAHDGTLAALVTKGLSA